jgi:hypothetical protein
MLVDHLYFFLHIERLQYFYALGRLTMPLFAFALGYGLAIQKDTDSKLPTIKRLLVFGLIASIPYIGLGSVMSGWWPLNIMFTFLISTLIISILTSSIKLRFLIALALFIICGAFVEYCWAGIGLTLSFWFFIRRPNWLSFLLILGSVIMLNNFNGSYWATLALPIIYIASKVNFPLPRIKHLFYYLYPIQFGLIWFARNI